MALVVFNIFVFSLVLRNVVFRPMLSTTSQLNKKREMFSRMQQFVLFWMLLGLSWIFGFLAMIPGRETYGLEILFCLFTSIQGFTLFIFICVKNPEVKKLFKQAKSYITEYVTERDTEHTDTGANNKTTTEDSIIETTKSDKRPPSPALSAVSEK